MRSSSRSTRRRRTVEQLWGVSRRLLGVYLERTKATDDRQHVDQFWWHPGIAGTVDRLPIRRPALRHILMVEGVTRRTERRRCSSSVSINAMSLRDGIPTAPIDFQAST